MATYQETRIVAENQTASHGGTVLLANARRRSDLGARVIVLVERAVRIVAENLPRPS